MILHWLAEGIGTCLLSGILFSLIFLYAPYDRIVVYGQTKGHAIKIRSIHLQKPGFVALYVRKKDGVDLAGYSQYLFPGYYKDYIIPIDFSIITGYEGREFFARIYRDDGDMVFIESRDSLLHERGGDVYQKKFVFLHPQNVIKEYWMAFEEHPVSTAIDLLIP